MPLIAAIHTNNLSRFISGFVGRKAMVGWAGALMLVAAVTCTSGRCYEIRPGHDCLASSGQGEYGTYDNRVERRVR